MNRVLTIVGDPEAACRRLLTFVADNIPLVGHMHVEIDGLDAKGLHLSAPLAPNSNHKRTAFGGSIHSICTLACWGLLWLLLEDEPDAHVVIHSSSMRYQQPVEGPLHACAPLPDDATTQRFLETFARRGRARISLHAHIGDANDPAASFEGRFVAVRGHRGRAMDEIRFPRTLINKLLHEAQGAAEKEVCGLVGARAGKPTSVYPVTNAARDDWASFALDPQGRTQALAQMRERGEELFAVYHSHPHAPAAPSVHDLADSADPGVLRLIISLDVKGVLQLSGWRLNSGGLEAVEIGLCEPDEKAR